jgi:hypothetical protein
MNVGNRRKSEDREYRVREARDSWGGTFGSLLDAIREFLEGRRVGEKFFHFTTSTMDGRIDVVVNS